MTAAGTWAAELAGPIIVKEVRQGLRARTFWIFFTLMLAVNFFIALVCLALAYRSTADYGHDAFVAFFMVLAFVQFFVIPYQAYRSMAREREDETWVLLTLTGLGARRILAGKVGSAVVQGLLYASAAAPFLLFSYFLNGVSLPVIVVGIALAAGLSVLLVSVAVCFATFATSRLARGGLQFLLLFGLLQSFITGAVMAVSAEHVTAPGAQLLIPLFFMVTSGVLLFEAAAARLALPTEDYARGVRLVYLVQLGGLLAATVAAPGSLDTRAALGLLWACIYAGTVGLFVMSDRDGMAKAHWSPGARFSLLKPGALRGFLLVTLSLIVVCAAGFALSGDALQLLSAPGWLLLLLSLAVVLSRPVRHAPWQTPVVTRLMYFLVLFVLVAGTALLDEVQVFDREVLQALNPLTSLNSRSAADPGFLTALWCLCLPAYALALLTLHRRDREWLA